MILAKYVGITLIWSWLNSYRISNQHALTANLHDFVIVGIVLISNILQQIIELLFDYTYNLGPTELGSDVDIEVKMRFHTTEVRDLPQGCCCESVA